MKAILVANVPYYHYLARALHNSGHLKKYITTFILLEQEQASRRLPEYLRKRLEGRRLSGVPGHKVKQIRMPELMVHGITRAKVASLDRALWLQNHHFDLMARRWVEDCDVLHFVSSTGLHSARKAKSAGAAIVCDVPQEHPSFQVRLLIEEQERFGLQAEIRGRLYEEKMLREFELADYFFVPSEHAKKTFIAEGFRDDQIFVLHYGIDLDHFHRVEREDAVFRILYVGQITLRKGLQYLLQAVNELKLPNSELLLIGKVDPAMEPILRRYEGAFRLIPSLPKVELLNYYSNSSVFVLPSLADSFALVVLEAMACGVPVIVTEHTGSKEVLREGVDGFVVPIRDVEAIKEKILFLYENRDVCKGMGEAARQRAEELTWDRRERRAAEIYDTIESRLRD
jgi:glycosyltransferase involved in cell wall biosynthesis